ncbi:hypothetical protein [Actinokineospora terrae]|uniref:Methyltransferase domain-containing protein n=1 Tax=Actinokineospora terrae TaxID=155974 RepID=A0A1H9UPQ3_9PSEU|nr:hypothetical protein [Actinokineospora terrae]SES11339.1 hypothetical protein SAMN04487818_107391 [Actinokineospora terrae]
MATRLTGAAHLLARARDHWNRPGMTSLSGAPVRTLPGTHQSTVNPYWDLASTVPVHERSLPVEGSGVLVEVLPPPHGPFGWWVPQKQIAWAVPSPGDLAWLAERLGGRPVLDLGAGLGYWSWQLHQLGVDTLAYDLGTGSRAWLDDVEPYATVHSGPAEVAADHPDRALLLCWPPANGMADTALRHYRGDTVIYIGELNPDVCAGHAFFTALERWDLLGHSPFHVNLYGFRGVLRAYRRREGNRPPRRTEGACQNSATSGTCDRW